MLVKSSMHETIKDTHKIDTASADGGSGSYEYEVMGADLSLCLTVSACCLPFLSLTAQIDPPMFGLMDPLCSGNIRVSDRVFFSSFSPPFQYGLYPPDSALFNPPGLAATGFSAFIIFHNVAMHMKL